MKRTLVAQSTLLVIAAPSDKPGTIAPFQVAAPSRIDHLIVEADAGDIAAFEALDTKVRRVAASGA